MGRDVRRGVRAIARAEGRPVGPAVHPGRVRSCDGPRARVAGVAYVEPWVIQLPAAAARATEVSVQPAVGGLSTADCAGWASESVFLHRKPLKDSSSWKHVRP